MLGETDIRKLLLAQLSLENNRNPSLIVEELGLRQGDARIDIAVINCHLHGYEIKSDRDTLRRLHGQERVYSQILDFVTVVTVNRHLSALKQQIPNWWGISIVVQEAKTQSIQVVRPATPNPQINPQAIVQLLWRKEALQLLQRSVPSLPRRKATRAEIWSQIVEYLPLEELKLEIRRALQSRQQWRLNRPGFSGDSVS